MECTPIPSNQLVEQLLASGHVTTRRPHHAQLLANDLNDWFSRAGFVTVMRDFEGKLDYEPNRSIEDLCKAIMSSTALPRLIAANDYPYVAEPYRSQGMTYRKDLFEGSSADALANCITAFDVYTLVVGPTAPARYTTGNDEICKSTAHQVHCENIRYANHDFDGHRLLPDERYLEWMTNLLRLRMFLLTNEDIFSEHPAWLFNGVLEAEKWLQTMTIEIDGIPIDDNDIFYIDNLEASRVTITTDLSVMLDPTFYKFLNQYGFDVERREYVKNYKTDLEYLESVGFSISQFNTKP